MRSPGPSHSPSPAPDDSDAQDAYARLGKLLNLDHLNEAPEPEEQNDNPSPAHDDGEEEFEFRLFSAPAKSAGTAKESEKEADHTSATQPARIRLHSPTPGSGDLAQGRVVSRGWDYYFSTPTLSATHSGEIKPEDQAQLAEKQQRFEDMAVSGDHIVEWTQSQPWVSAICLDLPSQFISH